MVQQIHVVRATLPGAGRVQDPLPESELAYSLGTDFGIGPIHTQHMIDIVQSMFSCRQMAWVCVPRKLAL